MRCGGRGADYVGQEVVKLSTTPFWEDGRLSPRPFTLRVFAAATPEGWRVMPGGFCRISDRADARAFSMGEGVRSADVWVLGDKPAEMVTLLPQSEAVKVRRLMGTLPSRAADNLFWLGRYLERAEATLRLIRCLCGRSIETDSISRGTRPTVERLQRLLIAWGAVPKPQKRRAVAAFASTALAPGARTTARPSRCRARRCAPRPRSGSACRRMPGGSSSRSRRGSTSRMRRCRRRSRPSIAPTRPCGPSRRFPA